MSVHGIKETKEALVLGVALIKAGKSALANGKIGIEDLPYLFSLISPLQAAIEGGYKIPAELADLQPEEWDELLSVAAPIIDLVTPDALEDFVWKALAAVKLLLESIGLIK